MRGCLADGHIGRLSQARENRRRKGRTRAKAGCRPGPRLIKDVTCQTAPLLDGCVQHALDLLIDGIDGLAGRFRPNIEKLDRLADVLERRWVRRDTFSDGARLSAASARSP
jgi:hypothetical protein